MKNNMSTKNLSIHDAQKAIIQEFAQLTDWMDRYEYLIQLGREFPGMKKELRTEQNALPGCQSRVWIHAEKTDDRMRFQADSDSVITKGILALLLRVFNDRFFEEIEGTELYFMAEIGLSRHLSPTRRDGLSLMVHHIQRLADQL
jgi:cysteine desulfuration protein SufE